MASKRKATDLGPPATAMHSDTEDEDSHTEDEVSSHTEDEDESGKPDVPRPVKRAAKKKKQAVDIKKDRKSNGPSAAQQKGGNAVASGSGSNKINSNSNSSGNGNSAPIVETGSSTSASSVRPNKPSSSSAAASTAVSSFFLPRSQKQLVAPKITWHTPLGQHESCLAGVYGNPFERAIKASASSSTAGSSAATSSSSSTNPGRFQKIAGFDLDDTLASAKTTRLPFRFEDENDWQIWGRDSSVKKTVVESVRAQSDAGALVVLVSNQSTLEEDDKVDLWKKRLGPIAEHIGRPFVIFAALRRDRYRKPHTAWVEDLQVMWREAGGEEAVGPLDVNMPVGAIHDDTRSFYVGDAAGREPGVNRPKKDHNDTDRKLAQNLGWRFFTPEAFFLKEKEAPYRMTGYHPDAALLNPLSSLVLPPPAATVPSPVPALLERLLSPTNPQTLLLLVGPQGSGKSHIARRLATSSSWTPVNRDRLGTQQKCLLAAAQALRAGKSVVIDNTSPTYAVRRSYLELLRGDPAVPVGVRKMAVHLDFPSHVVKHNEAFRVEYGESLADPEEAMRAKLPESAFTTYYKTLEAPTMQGDEGWDEVVRVQQFEFEGSEDIRRKWAQWYS